MPNSNTHAPIPPDVLAKLQEKIRAILGIFSHEDEDHWTIGDLFNQLSVIALKAGVSPHAYFEENVHAISTPTVYRYAAVAKVFAHEIATKYTISRLDAGLKYWKRAHLAPPTGDPGDALISVPRQDGTVNKRFADCTLEDLDAAIHTLKPAPVNVVDEEFKKLCAAFVGYMGADSGISLVEKAHGPRAATFNFENIARDQVSQFTNALSHAIVDSMFS